MGEGEGHWSQSLERMASLMGTQLSRILDQNRPSKGGDGKCRVPEKEQSGGDALLPPQKKKIK